MTETEGKNHGDRIRALMREAEDEVVVIAPFIKVGAMRSILEVIPPTVTVRCVTRWLPRDIAAGVSDPEIIDLLEERGNYSLSLVDNLHAKLYISDRECLAGSANVTFSGLGDAGEQNNIEILVGATVDDPFVAETLEAISRTERRASRLDAETARRLAANFNPLIMLASGEAPVWFPRSRRSERSYEFYRKPPTGYLSAAEKTLLADVASTNIQPGLAEREFKLEICHFLAQIPLAKSLLEDNKDIMLTRAESLPYIESIRGDEFTNEDLWQAFVNWMSYYFADKIMKQEITEIALRRAQVLNQ